jgi:alpha-galactosidase
MDPDFLETLFPVTMPFVDSRTEYTFWALWSAPLIIATDPRNMSASLRSIIMNQEVIEIDQDDSATAGTRLLSNPDGGEVWLRPLQGGDLALVLFNNNHKETLNPKPVNVSVTWNQLGLPQNASVKVCANALFRHT